MEKTNILPSGHQIGDKVVLNLFESGVINNCEVVGIKFNKPKVSYDIAVLVLESKRGDTSIGGEIENEEAMYTILENVDSTFVTKQTGFKISEEPADVVRNYPYEIDRLTKVKEIQQKHINEQDQLNFELTKEVERLRNEIDNLTGRF